MKNKTKKVLFLLVFVCFSGNLFSQQIFKDSSETYNYWASRGIIEMVYAYMQDFLITVDTNVFSDENKGAKAYCAKYIDSIDKKDSKEVEQDFQLLLQFLNQSNWAGTANKIVAPLIDNYIQHKQLDDQFFTNNTSYNNNQNWNEKKNSIVNNYIDELKLLEKKPEKIEQTDNLENSIKDATSKKSKKDSRSYVFKILFFLGGFIIGGFSIYLILRREIKSIISVEKNDYYYKFKVKEEDFISKIGLLNRQISELNAEKTKLLNENIELGELIESYKSKNIVTIPNETSDKEQVLISKSTYFTIPEIDGSFKIANEKYNKEIDCFYKIDIENNKQQGKLFFMSGDYDLRALDNIDYYLNPVCEIENISKRNDASKIEMMHPGIVNLSSNNWVIDPNNKVKIKLV